MRPTLALLAAALVTAPAAAQTDDAARRAYHQSLWGTVIPVAAGTTWWLASPRGEPGPGLLIAGGLVVGPALGYTSAGMAGRGWRGTGIRTGLTLLSFVPALAICGWDCSSTDPEAEWAWLFIATGSGLSLASAIYDISRVERNVTRHNAQKTGPGLSVVPMYAPGQHSVGMRLTLTF
jgi:hypothetical protein